MERMYGVLLPMDHFHCPFFFFNICSFARNTFCWKKSFQDLFPSLQERLNSHQENILFSLWLLFLLWEHSFISKSIYKAISEISAKYLEGPFNVNELHVRPNKYYVPCFDQTAQWANHWFNNWSKSYMIKYGMILNCLKSDVDLYYIKSVIQFG